MCDRSADLLAVTKLSAIPGSAPSFRRAAVALSIFVALAGFVGVAVTTRDTPGATVDSAEYLAVAQGLRTGHGLTSPYLSFGEPYPDVVRPAARVPLGHFPPLYPVTLAGLSAATRSQPLTAARWLGAATLAAVAGMITYLVARRSRSLIAAAAAGGLALAPDMLVAHSMAWTEGLFGLLVVTSVVLLDRRISRPTRANAAGLLVVAAAAPLARYAGIAVPIGVALALLVESTAPTRWRRVRDAALLGGGAFVPLVLWVTLSGHGVGRGSSGLTWHPPEAPEIHQGFAVVAGWLPVTGAAAWRTGVGCVVLIAAGALAGGIRRWRGPTTPPAADPSIDDVVAPRRRLVGIAAIMGVTYLAAVVASRLFVDAAIPFDARLLMPLHLMAAIGLPLAASGIDRTVVRRAALALAVLIAVTSVRDSVNAIRVFPRTNEGYLGSRWRRSAGIAAIRKLSGTTLVVTNAPDPVWLLTGRAPLFIPLRTDLYAARSNVHYRHELRALASALHGRRAVIVYFRRPTRSGRRYIDRQVVSTLELSPGQRLADATIYQRITTASGG